MSLKTSFPNIFDDALEIEVKDGRWTGTFSRTSDLSEGYPIFSKRKGSKETWQLKKKNGVWTFFSIKDGVWEPREQWNSHKKLWQKQDSTWKPISTTVTKWLTPEVKASDESWGDNLLRKMWEQEIGYDIKIKVQDGLEIEAHKAVIAAACPSSKRLMDSILDGQSPEIVISDIDPDAVKGFVKALYCGEFEEPNLLPGIALLADRYKSEELMQKVVQAMPNALETQGAGFYFEVIQTLKRLPDTENKRKIKALLFSMNRNISEETFYQRLGIN